MKLPGNSNGAKPLLQGELEAIELLDPKRRKGRTGDRVSGDRENSKA